MADADITVSVPGGKEAAAIVEGVANALRSLTRTQASAAADTRKAADAATKHAQALLNQARAAKDVLRDERARLDQIKQLNSANIQSANAEVRSQQDRLRAIQEASKAQVSAALAARREAVETARVYADATRKAAAYFQQLAQNRLKEAQATRITTKVGGLTVTTQNDALIRARRRELQEANENVARANALGQSQIRMANRVGQAQIAAANASVTAQQKALRGAQSTAAAVGVAAQRVVQAQQRVIRGAQQQATAQAQAATVAQRAAQQQVRAANAAQAAFQRQFRGSQTLMQGLDSLRRTVRNLVFAYSGFRAIEGFISAGLRFNQTIETSRFGIATLITATAQLEDAQGRLLTGTNALRAAQSLASDQLTKLRIAGIQTAATTEDLVISFQEAVAAGVSVGLTLDQIRAFTVSVAQAATQINLPFNQLNQEVRSILQGTIDRNSRIAKALNLTNQEVALAKQQNRLAELLTQKFQAFNVAGAESVKNFGALRSNIADAFSLFAGLATEPLFNQLRDAGLKALAEVFDFKSAQIQSSFRGLVEGSQVVFREVGLALAEAINLGVEGARRLSEFFQENRKEVKETAAAIGTMVREFGSLIGSLGTVIGLVSRLGGETNTVIGIARLLSDLFVNIRENILLITGLLAGRALVTTLGRLVVLLGAVRTAFTVGTLATAGSAFGPLGTAIGSLIGLLIAGGTAFRIFRGDERRAAVEAARTTTEIQDQKAKLGELVTQYVELSRAIADKNITTQESVVLDAQLQDIIKQFGANGGKAYVQILQDQILTIEQKKIALVELQRVEAQTAFTAAVDNLANLRNLRIERNELKKRMTDRIALGVTERIEQLRQQDRLKEINNLIVEAEAKQKTLQEQATRTGKALERSLTPPATIRPVRPAGTGGPMDLNKDLDDALQRARGEFERMQQVIGAMQEGVEAAFARGLISAEDRINALRVLAIAEIDAEELVLRAQLKKAQDRRITVKGKVVSQPDQGAIDAAEAQITGLESKRQRVTLQSETEITEIKRDEAAKRAKIEEDYLRATGQRFEAGRLEIQRRHAEQLREAIRDFGEGSQEVAMLRITIDKESLLEELDLVEDEIKKAEEQRNREVEAIRARFQALGKLSDTERQDQLDQISAANRRAVETTDLLRKRLIELRGSAQDPAVIAFIDLLLTRLDALTAKTTVVDVELRKLQEGFREAVERGIASFFEDIGDGSRTAAGLFKEMASSIINDLKRITAQLIASRIFKAILGAAESGGNAGAIGNQTQSEGRAGGGPGRPFHGRLRGGVRGVDSIPILAQEDEWFLKPAVRRKYGDTFLSMLNNLELPTIQARRFRPMAEGGVTGGNPVRSTVVREEIQRHLIGLDGDGVLTFLGGKAGERLVLGHVQRNPSAVNAGMRTRR